MAVAVEYVAHRKKKQYDPMSPPQLPTFGTVPILPHTFQIALRLSRPRTWTFAASSFMSCSGAVGLSFLSGVSVMGSVNLLNPVFLLLTYFMFTYGTVKNLPDYSCDKKAGTKSSATIFHSLVNAVRFSGILLFTPYILLSVFIAVAALGPIYLADLGMALIFAIIFFGMLKAKSSQELEKAHTFGFFYAISFMLFTLVLTSPTLASIIVILSAYLWTLLVSRVSLDSSVEIRDW